MGVLEGVMGRCESHFREWETKNGPQICALPNSTPPRSPHLGAPFPPGFLFSPSLSHLSSLKRLPVQFRILGLLPSLWKLQAPWPEGTQPGGHSPKTSALFPRPLRLPGLWGLGDTVGLLGSRVLRKLTKKASSCGVRRVAMGEVLQQ